MENDSVKAFLQLCSYYLTLGSLWYFSILQCHNKLAVYLLFFKYTMKATIIDSENIEQSKYQAYIKNSYSIKIGIYSYCPIIEALLT